MKKNHSYFRTSVLFVFICTSSFLTAKFSWASGEEFSTTKRQITPYSRLLELNEEKNLELVALGTAAAAAYEISEIFDSMNNRMEDHGYKLAYTLEDRKAKKIGLRVQAWEGENKIIIAVRGTDGSALLQNAVLSDFGGILFCALNGYQQPIRNHSLIRQHAQKMLRVFAEQQWGNSYKALGLQNMMDEVVWLAKNNLLVRIPAVTAIFSNLENFVNQKGTQNLIDSVILTLNFAAERARISPQKQVVFTGHSLGGFIASAAGLVSKASTVAWNAPGGVSEPTPIWWTRQYMIKGVNKGQIKWVVEVIQWSLRGRL